MSYHRLSYNKRANIKNGIYCFYKGKPCLHFATQAKAEHALEFVWESNYKDMQYIPVRAYYCNCGFWHLTSKQYICKAC